MAIDGNHLAIQTQTPDEAADRPRFRPSQHRAFRLVHHPQSWELVKTSDGNMWLPKLKPLYDAPGVNGIRRAGKRGTDSSHTRTVMADQGWIEIPANCIPEGSPLLDDGLTLVAGRHYMVTYQGARGKFNCLRWDRPRKVAGKWAIKTDVDGWNAFRKMLVEQGIVPQIEEDVREAILDRMRAKNQRNAKAAHVPTVAADIKATDALIAAGLDPNSVPQAAAS